MSLLALLNGAQIANGEIIDADDLKDNFNQLINLLNGTSNNKEALIKLTDAAVAPLTLNQLNASGPIQLWQANSVDKLKVNNLGQLQSLLATGTAPFVVASTTKVDNLNADLLDGLSSAAFGQIGTSKIPFTMAFKIADPSTFPLNDNVLSTYVRVPAINTAFITKISVWFQSGSHGAGTSLTIKPQISGLGFIGSGVVLNDTNNTIFTVYSDDFVDQAISEGNMITATITARSGTILERELSINIEGYQTLKL